MPHAARASQHCIAIKLPPPQHRASLNLPQPVSPQGQEGGLGGRRSEGPSQTLCSPAPCPPVRCNVLPGVPVCWACAHHVLTMWAGCIHKGAGRGRHSSDKGSLSCMRPPHHVQVRPHWQCHKAGLRASDVGLWPRPPRNARRLWTQGGGSQKRSARHAGVGSRLSLGSPGSSDFTFLRGSHPSPMDEVHSQGQWVGMARLALVCQLARCSEQMACAGPYVMSHEMACAGPGCGEAASTEEAGSPGCTPCSLPAKPHGRVAQSHHCHSHPDSTFESRCFKGSGRQG